MNGFALVFLIINGVALLTVPRRWAPLPLLMGAGYMTLGQGIVIGPLHFPIIRLIMLFGFVRVLIRRERLLGGLNGLDRIMLGFGAWAVLSSAFVHPLISQLGLAYNTLGTYFLIRIFCRTHDDIVHVIVMTAIILVPIAIEMIQEQMTGRNLFGVFGGVSEFVTIRDGKLRAQGPFDHGILAGTVGAAIFPLMFGLWHLHRKTAVMGLTACLVIVWASKSSGPIMSVLFGLFALILWRWRHLTKWMRIGAVAGYVLLDIVMKAPAYYLIARIDLTGSSTGDHRAALIEAAIAHLDEWWLAGTNYTRHWMAYGVSWSEDHVDITNQYIFYGVGGGALLMILFIGALWTGFKYIGRGLQSNGNLSTNENKFAWALGAALFAQAASCISIAYFDQSFVFLYTNIALIGSLYSYNVQQITNIDQIEHEPPFAQT